MSKPMAPGRDHRTHVGGGQIVAIELDVEHAGIDRALLDAGDQFAQPLGQRNSAALDADQRQVLAAVALFNDLVGQAHQSALDLRGGHQPAFDAQGGVSLVLRSWSLFPACLSQDDTRAAGMRQGT